MAIKKSTLKKYRSKREFTITKEPYGSKTKLGKKLIFVIQKHSSRRLHFDFRIEDEGVLKSWAIPKGPIVKPKERHLAIETEDHPLEYATFHGTIPKGEYGAGTVEVWDKGYFKNLSDQSISECIENGTVKIWLEGKKLKGAYALVRTKLNEDKKNWLFLKMKENEE